MDVDSDEHHPPTTSLRRNRPPASSALKITGHSVEKTLRQMTFTGVAKSGMIRPGISVTLSAFVAPAVQKTPVLELLDFATLNAQKTPKRNPEKCDKGSLIGWLGGGGVSEGRSISSLVSEAPCRCTGRRRRRRSPACCEKCRLHICLHMNNEKTCNYITAAPWDTPFTCV